MLDSATFLQIDALGLLAALFIALLLALYFFSGRGKSEENLTARWLIRNDPRVAQIVLSLSYLTSITRKSSGKGPLTRKKIRLLLDLREIIKSHQPGIMHEEIKTICRDIILISHHLEKQRKEK